jgi:hypothetical protein
VQCYAQTTQELPNPKKDVPLAVFSGRSIDPRADEHWQLISTLKVYPEAYNGPLLDYILMGVLMIERWRLSPWSDNEGTFSSGTIGK